MKTITIDSVLASGLVMAPAWAPLLNKFNQFLTTGALIIGLSIGVVRLWSLVGKEFIRKLGR